MRFWVIAVTVFAFSLAVSVANVLMVESGIFTLAPTFTTADDVSGSINETIQDLNASVGQIQSGSDDLWSIGYTVTMILNGLRLFVLTLGNATVMLPWMLQSFYVPGILAWGISSMVWIVYGLAIIQFLSGRQTKGME